MTGWPRVPPAVLDRALALLEAGQAPKIPQDNDRSTHCQKLEREHGHLTAAPGGGAGAPDSGVSTVARNLARLAGGERPLQIKVLQASIVESFSETAAPGTVRVDGSRFLVACGDKALELKEVQMEGRKQMSGADFVRGYGGLDGQVLQ